VVLVICVGGAVNENFFLFKNGDNKMLDTYVGFKNQVSRHATDIRHPPYT
jgi:hypothetical protein